MTPARPLPQASAVELGITVTPAVLSVFDGSTLTISPNAPLRAAGRRQAALSGLLYFFGGRIDSIDGFCGGYLGQSGDLDGCRAADSARNWVITQARILPAGMAILRRPQPYPADLRRFIEAKCIMGLSASHLWLLNKQSGAPAAAARLTRTQVLQGEMLAADICAAIRAHLFGGLANSHPSPASNLREAAVRTVREATRGMDTIEVMGALQAGGLRSNGVSWGYTIRRDLNLRERETRGTPRIFSCAHRSRRVFWSPALTKSQALAGYDLAHP
jgi:hypothetical protein